MSNLTDFIGGGSIVMNNRTLSEAIAYSPQITDGVNNLDAPSSSSFYSPIDYEFLSGNTTHQYDGTTVGVAFANRYLSSDKVKIKDTDSYLSDSDFFGLQADEIIIDGLLNVGFQTLGVYTPAYGRGFAGRNTQSGANKMLGSWDFMVRGGNGGAGYSGGGASGGMGFSGGGGDRSGFNDGGPGGSLILLVSESISGTGIIRAKGGRYTDNNTGGGGGGGMIIILTKTYSGTLTFDVSGGSPYSGYSAGQTGSYAILKINVDNTLTLMVHSQNGVSANLNGQTPVHGADASIAW